MHSPAITASRIPDAPRVWPVQPLVELHGVAVPNTSTIARFSIASFALVPGAVQIDIVDIGRRKLADSQCGAHRGDRARARGCGADI